MRRGGRGKEGGERGEEVEGAWGRSEIGGGYRGTNRWVSSVGNRWEYLSGDNDRVAEAQSTRKLLEVGWLFARGFLEAFRR